MAYGWGEHVGELRLEVEAATERDVFVDAARAFGELVAGEQAPAGPTLVREVAAGGADRALQLVGWLEELVFLAETEGFMPEAVEALELGQDEVRGRVRGRHGSPPHLVKAVTLHELRFEAGPEGWSASVVLDV